MPFTFSHPAIVLPLNYLPKKWISLTGLVIGSITPDFEYFIRMKVKSEYSHTGCGLFWFDLPLGILLAFLFHNIVKKSLFENLPKSFKSRIVKFLTFNWNAYFKNNWLIVILSLLIGAFSHLFWDSFTHQHDYFVENLPVLNNIVNISEHQIPLFKILQHTSTLIGGLFILLVLYKIPKAELETSKINPMYWIILTVLIITVIISRLMTGLKIEQYANLIVTFISAGIIGLILTPIIMKMQKNLLFILVLISILSCKTKNQKHAYKTGEWTFNKCVRPTDAVLYSDYIVLLENNRNSHDMFGNDNRFADSKFTVINYLTNQR